MQLCLFNTETHKTEPEITEDLAQLNSNCHNISIISFK